MEFIKKQKYVIKNIFNHKKLNEDLEIEVKQVWIHKIRFDWEDDILGVVETTMTQERLRQLIEEAKDTSK